MEVAGATAGTVPASEVIWVSPKKPARLKSTVTASARLSRDASETRTVVARLAVESARVTGPGAASVAVDDETALIERGWKLS